MHTFTQTDSLFTVKPPITDKHTHTEPAEHVYRHSFPTQRHHQGRDGQPYSYVLGVRVDANLVGN